MPVIRDIPLSLKTGEVLRCEGFRGHSKIRLEIKSLILELLASVKKAHLLEPAIAYEVYSITQMRKRQLPLEELLPGAKELAIVVATIGPRLEKQAIDYFDQGEPLRGTLLDGIGSAAVDSLIEEAGKFITGEAKLWGYQASSPINPGMPGLPITEQRRLIKMVPAEEIGVSLTSAGIMVPRKSTSLVIGIGPEMKTWTRTEICARCNLNKTCPYRVSAQ